MKQLTEAIEQITTYSRGVWLHRRYVIITAWLACLLGWYVVHQLPPVYESESKLYVETQTMLEPLLKGIAIRNNPDQEIKLLAKTLLSRPNLVKIARETDLDLQAVNDKQYESLIDTLMEDIKIQSSGRENIYVIRYHNKSPQLALKVVQATLNTFVENHLGSSRADSKGAEKFLSEQIAEYETRLVEAERKLSEFKKNKMFMMPSSESNYYSRLSAEKQNLESATLELQQLETRLVLAKAQLAPGSSDGGSTVSPDFVTPFDERIASLNTSLDGLLIKYTENHPDVVETQRLLSFLKQQRQEMLTQVASSDQSAGVANEYVQQLKMNVSELEAQVASVRVKVAAYSRKVVEFESRLSQIPEIEAEYTGLNRDYEINRSQYEALLTRREAAELARKADVSEQDAQFRVIDPPRVPITPSGPKRLLLYTAVLIGAFGLGVMIAFIRSQISPTLISVSQLRTISEIPVFGFVSHTNKPQLLRRIRLHFIYFVLLTGLLLTLYATIMVNELLFGGTAEAISRVLK
ncbi:chain length-determining protein [Rheinheimera baltica]|uniref:Chain length-determining protein n=2 Tax=Rheinheimera baltica TaxID=67576 RepID=A0ABT9HU89_9GAMM|nr:XrtA system polysaccharide chain length determinant [Rheinheimera baltica]MDP5134683.1 chain length-determining protein [Rheinheimera baltica]MDP5141562.1 chain length-determining protein [Rheinheimera baltica]